MPVPPFDMLADGLVISDAPSSSTNVRPKKRSKPADSVVERTRSVFERAFPDHVDPVSYSESLLVSLREAPDVWRGRSFESLVRQLFYLERTAIICGKPEVAEEIGKSKRMFVSKVLSAVYEKLGNPEYRKSNLAAWSEWLLAKAAVDIRDFAFWNGWHDRFLYESASLLPGTDLDITL